MHLTEPQNMEVKSDRLEGRNRQFNNILPFKKKLHKKVSKEIENLNSTKTN